MDTSNHANIVDKLKKLEGRKRRLIQRIILHINFGNELATHFVPKHDYGDLVIFERRKV